MPHLSPTADGSSAYRRTSLHSQTNGSSAHLGIGHNSRPALSLPLSPAAAHPHRQHHRSHDLVSHSQHHHHHHHHPHHHHRHQQPSHHGGETRHYHDHEPSPSVKRQQQQQQQQQHLDFQSSAPLPHTDLLSPASALAIPADQPPSPTEQDIQAELANLDALVLSDVDGPGFGNERSNWQRRNRKRTRQVEDRECYRRKVSVHLHIYLYISHSPNLHTNLELTRVLSVAGHAT